MALITILLTHSRGAFLASVATLFLIAWRSGRLIQASGVLALCVCAFFVFAPQHVKDRLASIKQGSEESSAGARITAWTIALRMIDANPVFGVGMRNFQEHYTRHGEGLLEPGKVFAYVAHNSYLQIWAEGGTISFILYLWLLFSVFFTTRWIRMRAHRFENLGWAFHYSRMMEATTFGFMIGAVFLNRGHFDLIYHWLALVTCLAFVFRHELRADVLAHPDAVSTPVVADGIKVGWRPALGNSPLPRW